MSRAAAFGVYVHVPYCTARCGYCDFNTYTARALRGGASPATFAAGAAAEVALMRARLGPRPVATVFFGGGTPTLLEPDAIAAILRAIDPRPGAEVTVEANPESVDGPYFEALLAAGVTRISLGMQSAREHVLAVLERRHTPGRAVAAAREARAAGFDHVSVDLIYGTPGESDDDWRASLDAALSAEPDHVSAYGLIVEPGTRMAAQVRRGALPAPDEDAQARRFEIADAVLSAAGLPWYELCSWASGPGGRCRHNLAYWSGGEWWGVGPGAHSHLGGVRWWNVLHPADWAARLQRGESPEAGREELGPQERHLERIMLGLRLAEGLPREDLDAGAAAAFADEGLLEVDEGRAVLTLRGRLIADTVIRGLAWPRVAA